MTSSQAMCEDCHRFMPLAQSPDSRICWKCQLNRLLKTEIDTSGYDFTQPVVYKRRKK